MPVLRVVRNNRMMTIDSLVSKSRLPNRELNDQIGYILEHLGVKSSMKGFMYLREAVRIAMENFNEVFQITNILYPVVAKLYKTKASSVERCIRFAIRTIEEEGVIYESDFLMKMDCDRDFTNKEFILGLAEMLIYANQV